MQIISHRGYWKTQEEKNSVIAFERSFSLGFGTETDIRDYKSELVISHDIADEKCIRLSTFFEIYKSFAKNLPLALNIKADGLQVQIKHLLARYNITNYFVFDMSVPDTIGYLKSNINTFTRQSEYELNPVFYTEAKGVWMDSFIGDWIEERDISQHMSANKIVCLVSPDLHKREFKLFWRKLSNMAIQRNDSMMLCTDQPEEARSFFDE